MVVFYGLENSKIIAMVITAVYYNVYAKKVVPNHVLY